MTDLSPSDLRFNRDQLDASRIEALSHWRQGAENDDADEIHAEEQHAKRIERIEERWERGEPV